MEIIAHKYTNSREELIRPGELPIPTLRPSVGEKGQTVRVFVLGQKKGRYKKRHVGWFRKRNMSERMQTSGTPADSCTKSGKGHSEAIEKPHTSYHLFSSKKCFKPLSWQTPCLPQTRSVERLEGREQKFLSTSHLQFPTTFQFHLNPPLSLGPSPAHKTFTW